MDASLFEVACLSSRYVARRR